MFSNGKITFGGITMFSNCNITMSLDIFNVFNGFNGRITMFSSVFNVFK